jgi:molybdate transport system substrate-binding protein
MARLSLGCKRLKSLSKSDQIILNYMPPVMPLRSTARRHASTKAVQRLLAGATVAAAISTPVAAQPPGLVVSVAASLQQALAEIAGLYRAATGVTVAINSGGSHTLARQIVEGAKAGLFISADAIQMDHVEKAGRLVPGTRTRLVTNELAIVVAPDAPADLTLARLLEGRVTRLAMGEPSSVPAGVYGRMWLERQGAWARLSPKVVPFPTVRAVLAAVVAGRVDAGIVYRTDAMTANVRVLGRVSAADHPYLDIVQPAAVIRGPFEAEARRFLDFLATAPARAVLARHGFGVP